MSTHSYLKKYGRLDLENKPEELKKFIEDKLARAEANEVERRHRYETDALASRTCDVRKDGLNENVDTSRPATREDYEAMAYRNGWTVNFQGEVLNPNREKWPGFLASSPATLHAKRSPTEPPK